MPREGLFGSFPRVGVGRFTQLTDLNRVAHFVKKVESPVDSCGYYAFSRYNWPLKILPKRQSQYIFGELLMCGYFLGYLATIKPG